MIGIEDKDRVALSEALLAGARSVLGADVHDQLAATRVLLVGAGGIGCEVLKNLVCSGFQAVTVVDLDTIELSNLNRQFLFTRSDIGRPKAVVATEAVRRLYPGAAAAAQLTALVANIKTLNAAFFAGFDVVLSALDNLDARRHVNLMAVVCGVPVVESGTAGHSGQCGVWLAGCASECFDCRHHSPPTTYPVCTIRVTPTQMIHCIVWAKEYLLDKAFNQRPEDDADLDAIEDQQVAASLRREAAAFEAIADSETDEQFAVALYEKIFIADIHAALSLAELWKDRANKPVPLPKYEELASRGSDYKTASVLLEWDLAAWTDCFIGSAQELRARPRPILFDKDDEVVAAFVAAAANLRAHSFACTPHRVSLFKAKEMAGNIIPAVASTNSIAAALACLQAINIVRQPALCANVYITHGAPGRVLTRERLEPGDPDCAVCANTRLRLTVHSEDVSLKQVVDALIASLSLQGHDDISVLFNSRLIYDSIDMSEETLARPLHAFGIRIGDVITLVAGEERPVLVGLFPGERLECVRVHLARNPRPVKRSKEGDDCDDNDENDDNDNDNYCGKSDRAKVMKLDEDDMIIV